MTRIEVECAPTADGHRCAVTVHDGQGSTRHDVAVAASATGADDVEHLVRETFVFLLEREPKESILRSFDLSVVSRYFPEYEAEIRSRLSG